MIPLFLDVYMIFQWGFPGGTSGKATACQCRRWGFDPWVRKILQGIWNDNLPSSLFFYITIHKRDDQCKLDAWSRTLRAGVLKQSKGWRREEGECGVLDGGTHAHPWLIHVDVWQYTHFNAILSNHPTLAFSHRVQKSVLYICVSFAVSHTGLSLPSF